MASSPHRGSTCPMINGALAWRHRQDVRGSRRAPRRLSPSRCAPLHPPIEARRADGHQRQCVPRETWTRALTKDGHHSADEPSRVLTSDPALDWTSSRNDPHVPSCVVHRVLQTRACRGVSQGKSFSASHLIAVCLGRRTAGETRSSSEPPGSDSSCASSGSRRAWTTAGAPRNLESKTEWRRFEPHVPRETRRHKTSGSSRLPPADDDSTVSLLHELK